MAQPKTGPTRQSGPQAKKANMDALHTLTPGGPILPKTQPLGKPMPGDRGKEENTSFHKGTPNPEQHGTHKNREDHNPGMGQAGDVHRPNVPVVTADASLKHSAKGTKVAPPMPDPMGVRK